VLFACDIGLNIIHYFCLANELQSSINVKGCYGMLDPIEADSLRYLLTTTCFGRTLYVLPETSSTNDDLKRLAARHAPEGTVVVADHQTKGRGRLGRSFVSPPGVGIYLSLLVYPRVELSRLSQLTLLVAVATAETLAEISGLAIHLKWPNDVEIGGQKVSGILTEAIMQPTVSPAVIIGIGINVNNELEHFPPGLQNRATSLALTAGQHFSRMQIIARLLSHLEDLYGSWQQTGIAPVLERWLHYGSIVGRAVRFSDADATRRGVVIGLDEDGALLVETDAPALQRIHSGEIIFL
jgi:BirA family biotin operon repressor/biotin-[acetyl-CoA-carboxylase] ligase